MNYIISWGQCPFRNTLLHLRSSSLEDRAFVNFRERGHHIDRLRPSTPHWAAGGVYLENLCVEWSAGT